MTSMTRMPSLDSTRHTRGGFKTKTLPPCSLNPNTTADGARNVNEKEREMGERTFTTCCDGSQCTQTNIYTHTFTLAAQHRQWFVWGKSKCVSDSVWLAFTCARLECTLGVLMPPASKNKIHSHTFNVCRRLKSVMEIKRFSKLKKSIENVYNKLMK